MNNKFKMQTKPRFVYLHNAHPRDIVNAASKIVLNLMKLDRREPTPAFNKNDRNQTPTETQAMFRDSSP